MIGSACPIAIVIIGRNEGERLRTCFHSVSAHDRRVVYVDSGSTDGSVQLAASMGIDCVSLDMRTPFTAARARNAGFARLRSSGDSVKYVQFVDGDCEIALDWIDQAVAFLEAQPAVAVVCGRRRERFPERSIYNRLCDIEWAIPAGEILSCGGDALMRASVFEKVGGYNPMLIAGEEPELCVRLRRANWKIWCIDHPMTMHDASMLRFRQWWQRTKRAGYAFAEGAALHGAPPERHWVRESRSALFWGLCIPLAILFAAMLLGPKAFLLLSIYPIQIIRLALRGQSDMPQKWWRAFYLVIGKFPEMLGGLSYLVNRRLHKQSVLIEYK
jgi:GT2 family glycosyltransferase